MVMQLHAYNVQVGQLRELNVDNKVMQPTYIPPSRMRFEGSNHLAPGYTAIVPGKCQCPSRKLRVLGVDPDAAAALVDAVDMFGPASIDSIQTIKLTCTANITFFDARDAERAQRGIPKIHSLTNVVVEQVQTSEVAVLVLLNASHENVPKETLYCTLAQYGPLDCFHFERLPGDQVQLLCTYFDVRGSWMVPSSLTVLYTTIYPKVVEVDHQRICAESGAGSFGSAMSLGTDTGVVKGHNRLSVHATPFLPAYEPTIKSPTLSRPGRLSPLVNGASEGGYSPPLPTPAETASNSGTPAVGSLAFFGLKQSQSTASFKSLYRRGQDRLWFDAPVVPPHSASTSPLAQVSPTPIGSPKMQTPPVLSMPGPSVAKHSLWNTRSSGADTFKIEKGVGLGGKGEQGVKTEPMVKTEPIVKTEVQDPTSQLDMGLQPLKRVARGVITRGDVSKENQVNLDLIDKGLETRTTVMLRNIPNKVDQRTLQEFLDLTNKNTYDFLYLRIDFNNRCNVGYAFISFTHPSHVGTFARARCGCKWNKHNSDKIIDLSFANVQGRDALIQKFRNSPVMDMHPAYRPKLFYTEGALTGKEEPFPKRYQRSQKS